jgi:uncharacterized membrane protein
MSGMDAGAQAGVVPLFEAVIVPHRSLSRRGLAILVGALCLLSSATATGFWLLGAWPVAGFSGAEILLAVALLRINARSARASEVLLLEEGGLRIIRTDPRGRREERVLPAGWLSLQLEERQGSVPRLWLTARGVREQVAAALGEEEKRDLAAALGRALHRQRNPVFDNPQLRDAVSSPTDPST